MSTARPLPGWTPVGSTFNTQYYHSSPDILVVMPNQGLKDDGPSARANADFQIDFARKLGRPVGLVVLLGSLTSQDSTARRIYSTELVPPSFYASGLVVTNPISRAVGSFFLGLSRPKFPAKLFESFERAIDWVATVRPA
jgi:hypothetical protein